MKSQEYKNEGVNMSMEEEFIYGNIENIKTKWMMNGYKKAKLKKQKENQIEAREFVGKNKKI